MDVLAFIGWGKPMEFKVRLGARWDKDEGGRVRLVGLAEDEGVKLGVRRLVVLVGGEGGGMDRVSGEVGFCWKGDVKESMSLMVLGDKVDEGDDRIVMKSL